MKRNFKSAEILQSVDILLSDKKYSGYDKNRIGDNYKNFKTENVKMKDDIFQKYGVETPKSDDKELDNQDHNSNDEKINDYISEKIILDAEKSLKNKKMGRQYIKPLVLKNLGEEKKSLEKTYKEVLVLKEEFVEEDDNEKNNYLYINEKLRSQNIEQDEKIKDLNILINKFNSDERFSDLNKKIKLYQQDNAALRKKIFTLSDIESELRLKLANLEMNKDFDERKNKNLNEPPLVLRKEIKGLNKESKVTKNTNFENLNKELLILKQENKELKGEVLNIKRDKDSYLKKIDEKIEFYREENEKIIVDKSDIQKKLENTKSQLRMNENNKRELRIALDNLNKILAKSNIESSTFVKNTEEQSNNPKNNYKKTGSQSTLDDDSLDLLVKEYLKNKFSL
jgi:hypothetical protein